MDGVDPLPPRQIDVVRSREEPDQTVGILLPHSEGERDRVRVDLDVVVADEDGDGGDGGGSGEEPGVEAAGGVGDDGDRRGSEGESGEVVGELGEGLGRGGGVAP